MENRHPLEVLFIQYGAPLVWAARISKVNDLDLQHTLDAFDDADQFIVSEEGTGIRLHQHLLIADHTFDRQKVLETIKKAYPAAKGNKNLYVKKAENFGQLLKYTLKEGNYMSKGFTDLLLTDMEMLAMPKTEVKQKFIDLEDKLLLQQITFFEFMLRYVQLKVDHGQNIYNNHLIAYFRRFALRTETFSMKQYVQELENKIFE